MRLKINVVRSSEYDLEKFNDVMDLLRRFPGPMQFSSTDSIISMDDVFISKEKFQRKKFETQNEFISYCRIADLQSVKVLSWHDIFRKCKEFRIQNDVGNDEYVILLTEYSNENNWFAAGNPDGSNDIFVQTDNWDYFLGSDQRFPVTYQIVTGVLKRILFTDYDDLQSHWHETPRGCMLDFCKNKMQIALKLRTGDICQDCLKLLSERNIDTGIISQVFAVMDSISSQMKYKERFVITQCPPEMHITGRNKKITFPELGDLEIRLTPLEKTVYLFFLNHSEGVELTSVQDYRGEILDIYSGISNADDVETIQLRIDDLVNPLSNSLSEKMARIKRKFGDALGVEMAKQFVISGENAGKRIVSLEREKIIFG